jgi:cyclophilin family peptidyl-prolyl cis-trans isomerase
MNTIINNPANNTSRRKNSNKFLQRLWLLIGISMFTGFFIVFLLSKSTSQQQQRPLTNNPAPENSLQTAQLKINHLQQLIQNELEPLRIMNTKLQNDLEICTKQSLNPNNPDTDTTKKLLTIQTRFERTKRIAQQLSLQRLQQKYPNNNNKISFTITTSLGILTAETFPFKESPVTIEYFLTLVEQHTYSDASFFRVEHHVVQATPNHHNHHGVLFQETNKHKNAHDKFTLGLAGRPGGPDFYVNMMENHQTHGPGGQGEEYPGDVEADPCFAILTHGQELITTIQHLPYNKENGLRILKEKIKIISININ